MVQERSSDPIRPYLNDIRRTPLLSRADEARLGRLVIEGQEAAEELDRSKPQMRPARRRQLERAVAEGELAVHEIAMANLRLVVSVAKRYSSSALPLPDLIQEGNIGLLHAARRYDYRRGFKFSTAATAWIGQAIARAVGTKGRDIRLPTALDRNLLLLRHPLATRPASESRDAWMARVTAETGLSPEQVQEAERHARDTVSLSDPLTTEELSYSDVVEDPRADAPFDEVDNALRAASVRNLLSELPEREREVIRLRYGIGAPRRHTLREVGQRLGVSLERVRQIESTALARLQRPAIRNDVVYRD